MTNRAKPCHALPVAGRRSPVARARKWLGQGSGRGAVGPCRQANTGPNPGAPNGVGDAEIPCGDRDCDPRIRIAGRIGRRSRRDGSRSSSFALGQEGSSQRTQRRHSEHDGSGEEGRSVFDLHNIGHEDRRQRVDRGEAAKPRSHPFADGNVDGDKSPLPPCSLCLRCVRCDEPLRPQPRRLPGVPNLGSRRTGRPCGSATDRTARWPPGRSGRCRGPTGPERPVPRRCRSPASAPGPS